jgi:segregation and condensation protein A
LAPPPKVQGVLDLSDFTLADLVDAARQAFIEADNRQDLGTVVAAPRVTIREKIGLIVKSVKKGGTTTFRHLLGDRRTRLDIVVTFLAMLELVKLHFIKAKQERIFGDITIQPADLWQDDTEFELEFGE